jgi:hypothetical protein
MTEGMSEEGDGTSLTTSLDLGNLYERFARPYWELDPADWSDPNRRVQSGDGIRTPITVRMSVHPMPWTLLSRWSASPCVQGSVNPPRLTRQRRDSTHLVVVELTRTHRRRRNTRAAQAPSRESTGAAWAVVRVGVTELAAPFLPQCAHSAPSGAREALRGRL